MAPCRGIVLGALLGFVLGGAPAWAQLAAEPAGFAVTVPQGETVTQTVTLANAGSASLAFCVTFDRPLQRVGGAARLAEGAVGGGAPCGAYGEVLHAFDEDDLGGGWDPFAITMTPGGQLFTAELSGPHRTFEFTPDLALLRSFVHPHIAKLVPFPGTPGVTYDTESGTLWWMNSERAGGGGNNQTRRILLLEGDLNGVETGRRIEIVPQDAPLGSFNPGGLSYDVATDLFYTRGILGERNDQENWKLWAVDRVGTLAEGYPLRPEPYPPPASLGHPDVLGGAEGDPEGVRIEYAAFPPGALGFDRIAVVDRWGNSEGAALETPVPAVLFEAGGAGPRGNPLRSRVDPNGVMYMTFANFNGAGIVGVRPHPLPPSWLVVDSDEGPEAAWDGTLAPGASREVTLTFRAGARALGDYTSALQAFDAATGEAVEVPLTLTVTQGVAAEGEAAAPAMASLTVYPNPFHGDATVALMLDVAATVRVVVYDVLGRAVATLADGALGAGTHERSLDGRALPAGLYLVRVEGNGFSAVRRVTVLR